MKTIEKRLAVFSQRQCYSSNNPNQQYRYESVNHQWQGKAEHKSMWAQNTCMYFVLLSRNLEGSEPQAERSETNNDDDVPNQKIE
jgi:hypothetical protein